MADIDAYTKAGGKFLRADDVIESPEKSFVITDEAQLQTDEKFGGERLHIPGTFNGEEKIFNSSRTNARAISEVLTPETSKWVGGILILETYRTKVSEGRMVDAINVREVKCAASENPAAEPAAEPTA